MLVNPPPPRCEQILASALPPSLSDQSTTRLANPDVSQLQTDQPARGDDANVTTAIIQPNRVNLAIQNIHSNRFQHLLTKDMDVYVF